MSVSTNLLPFFLTKEDLYEKYKIYQSDQIEAKNIVAYYDTGYDSGEFPHSDLICMYDKSGNPSVITERIYKKNYTFLDWLRLRKRLKHKCKTMPQEFSFHTTVTLGKDYIDCIHYKLWWYKEWLVKNQSRSA